jgi:hypothetical protein
LTDFLPQITKQNYQKNSPNYRDPKLPKKTASNYRIGLFFGNVSFTVQNSDNIDFGGCCSIVGPMYDVLQRREGVCGFVGLEYNH